jgi:hypothetical protein
MVLQLQPHGNPGILDAESRHSPSLSSPFSIFWSSKAFLFFVKIFFRNRQLQNCSKLHLSQTAFDVCAHSMSSKIVSFAGEQERHYADS